MSKKIIVISLLALVVVSGTFAWYSWTSTTNTNVTVTIEGNMEVTYNGGPDIIDKELIPVASKTNSEKAIQKEITAKTNSGTAGLELFLDLKVLPNGLKHNSFKYELYNSTTSTLISKGTFASYSQGDTISLTPTAQSITTTQTTYILYIWLDGTMDNPTSVLDQDYHFELYATGDGELAG